MSGTIGDKPGWGARILAGLKSSKGGSAKPPSLHSYAIHDLVWPQLFELELEKGRPLAVFDADDVLLDFAGHFDRYLGERGYRLSFRPGYRHTVTPITEGAEPIETAISDPLVDQFFVTETRRQTAFPGAASALARLQAEGAQAIVLTNCPIGAREDRIFNLGSQEMPLPVVANIGPKGPVLKYLADQVRAPVAFADDTPRQIFSAAKSAPEVHLLHFAADPWVREAAGFSESAHHAPESWPELEERMRRHLLG